MHDLIAWIIGFAANTVVLTALLWIMVKLQKLNYVFLGLLGSAALACALDTLPYFGHYLAVAVLYLCIWKVTQASLMPDAVFTVAVSYALMFAVKVCLLTMLIGDLRPAAVTGDLADEGDETPAAETATNALSHVADAATAASQMKPGSAQKKNSKSADEILKDITVKGATENGAKSMLIISTEKKIYTLTTSEQTAVQTASGSCRMRLMSVDPVWAVVWVNGEKAFLRIRKAQE